MVEAVAEAETLDPARFETVCDAPKLTGFFVAWGFTTMATSGGNFGFTVWTSPFAVPGPQPDFPHSRRRSNMLVFFVDFGDPEASAAAEIPTTPLASKSPATRKARRMMMFYGVLLLVLANDIPRFSEKTPATQIGHTDDRAPSEFGEN